MQEDVAHQLIEYHQILKEIKNHTKHYVFLDLHELEDATLKESYNILSEKYKNKVAGQYLLAPWGFEPIKGRTLRSNLWIPFWLKVEILEDKELRPDSKFPWPIIPEELLEPTTDQNSNQMILGSKAAVDTFFTLHPLTPEKAFQSLDEAVAYTENLFKFLIDGRYLEKIQDQGYQKINKAILLNLSHLDKLSPPNTTSPKPSLLKTKSDRKILTGLWNGCAQLSLERRENTLKLLNLEGSEASVLQPWVQGVDNFFHIFATQWVEAAICEAMPPCFAVIEPEDSILRQIGMTATVRNSTAFSSALKFHRWLPLLSTMGAYLCESRSEDVDDHAVWIKKSRKNFDSNLVAFKMPEYRQQAIDTFLMNATNHFKKAFSSLEEAKNYILAALKKSHSEQKRGLELYSAVDAVHHQLDSEYARHGGFQTRFEHLSQEIESARNEFESIQTLYDKWNAYLQNETRMQRALSFLPWIKDKIQQNDVALIAQYSNGCDVKTGNRKTCHAKISNLYQDALQKLKGLEKSLNHLEAEWQRLEAAHQEFEQWLIQATLEPNPKYWVQKKLLPHVLEQHFSGEQFILATHYYEALWLSEIDDKEPIEIAHYLTPVLYGKPEAFIQNSPFESFDKLVLLGKERISPLVLQCLQRKAAQVIEVVDPFSISYVLGSRVIEKSLAKILQTDADEAEEEDDMYDEEMLRSTLSAASKQLPMPQVLVNLMQDLFLQRGYEGLENSIHHPMPALSLVDVKGESEAVLGSLIRVSEAVAIVDWLHEHHTEITVRYPGKLLRETLLVATPYNAQKEYLSELLAERGFGQIPVITFGEARGLHSNIVLFSAVATNQNPRPFLVDREPGFFASVLMSAHDSFVLFADQEILVSSSRTPSGMLAKALEAKPRPVLKLDMIEELL